MANKKNQENYTSRLWVKITCGILGFLMIGAIVFMLVQVLMA